MPLISPVLNEGKIYHVCSEKIEVKNLQTILTRAELEKEAKRFPTYEIYDMLFGTSC